MKVLVIGGGGKEHALIWKLSRSKHIAKIYCSPGNAGIAEIAECIDVSPKNVDALVDFVKHEWIDLTIICSETFMAEDIMDTFERHGCSIFGLNRESWLLGKTRASLKNFMKRHRIPTAEYQIFSSYLLALDYVQLKGLPLVIKTDGYPGERGVFLASSTEEAADTLKRIMKGKMFGESGNRVIIEERLKGERISVVTMADERIVMPIASVRKFREISDQQLSADTIVYGSYSPVPLMTKEIENDVMEKVMHPLHRAIYAQGIPFRGFISADCVVQNGGIYLAELQFGFGDLEAQTIMPRVKADLGELILSAAEGRLSNVQIKPDDMIAFSLALFSTKHPSEGSAGIMIRGLDAIEKMEDVFVFHENTVFDDGGVVTPGGTALYITAKGSDVSEAIAKAINTAEKIHFDGMLYRKKFGRY